jgi:hypothetical protein
MRRSLRAIALSCLLISFLGAAAWGQPTSADWTIDNFRRTEPLAPAARLAVLNPYGDVRLRAADGGEVEVSAMIQRRASEPATAQVKIRRHRDRLIIEVVYPAASRSKLRRVDLAVFVPVGVPVAVRTRDGLIEERELANDVELEPEEIVELRGAETVGPSVPTSFDGDLRDLPRVREWRPAIRSRRSRGGTSGRRASWRESPSRGSIRCSRHRHGPRSALWTPRS